MTEPQFLSTAQGRTLAYHHTRGALSGVMFLGGFKSDMTGSKALALEAHCRQRGQAFTRFDYSGHGQSSGVFKEGSIGDWFADALAVFDTVTEGAQVLVGSSMGGWMMLLLALARPERVAGLVGIAAAPDFTTRLMWARMTPKQQAQLTEQGVLATPSEYSDDPYLITRRLIEESKAHLLMDAAIDIHCPVHLLQGMADADVPWHYACELAEKIASEQAQVSLVKGAGHRFSEPEQIAMICKAVDEMLDR